VSTHVPLQSVGVAAGQPETHVYPALADPEQTGVPPPHETVQLPQCAAWVMFVSQPSAGSPLQSAQPAAHADPEKEHLPAAVQVVAPLTFGRFVQSFVHEPQWCRSPSDTQAPPQDVNAAPQTHLPAEQTWPTAHAAPQPPQLFASVW